MTKEPTTSTSGFTDAWGEATIVSVAKLSGGTNNVEFDCSANVAYTVSYRNEHMILIPMESGSKKARPSSERLPRLRSRSSSAAEGVRAVSAAAA